MPFSRDAVQCETPATKMPQQDRCHFRGLFPPGTSSFRRKCQKFIQRAFGMSGPAVAGPTGNEASPSHIWEWDGPCGFRVCQDALRSSHVIDFREIVTRLWGVSPEPFDFPIASVSRRETRVWTRRSFEPTGFRAFLQNLSGVLPRASQRFFNRNARLSKTARAGTWSSKRP